ncbi:MAG: dephospho-CoA kinase [Planctomycetota bacterium]|nr:dephospho-CoA kinase [Planctomycetota bacterium]
MKIIGILGGVASGKSLVAEQFRHLGAKVLDADQVGHLVLREPEVIRAARDRWGDAILAEDGQINRSEVAKIVFAPPPGGSEELAFLEQLTHPRIGARLQQLFEQMRHSRDSKAVILDAPVMLKSGWDKFCDHILFIEVPRNLRLQRARERGWSAAHFAARESAQESLETKRAAADHVIDNSTTVDSTRQQVKSFWDSLD